MEFMLGGVIQFGGNFAPKDWAFCQGQLIAISQNQALYAILGTTWGGDGRTNFGLPDLQSRVPIGVGRGVGLSAVREGFKTGSESHKMALAELPTHTHTAIFQGTGGSSSTLSATATVNAHNDIGDKDTAAGNYWATTSQGTGRDQNTIANGYAASGGSTMAADAVTVNIVGSGGGITGGDVSVNPSGGGQNFSIMQPTLGIQFLIAVEGTFPSRN